MLTAQDVHILDKNAEFFGVPTSTLMENAGIGVAEFISKLEKQPKKIICFCGKGNNGGDGFVAARYLSKNYNVSVVTTGEPKTQLAKQNYCRIQESSIHFEKPKDIDKIAAVIKDNDLVIDAMLGVGLEGELREPYTSYVSAINNSGKPIIAVDVPTGLGTKLSVHPQYTVTFHEEKYGMNHENCGIIHCVDIGIPDKARLYVGPGELSILYPRNQRTSHKGDNGTVLVIGGGPYCGAPALTGMAALRTGADLVHIATPKKSWQTVALVSPNLIVHELSADVLVTNDIPFINELVADVRTVILGPGLGKDERTQKTVISLVKEIVSQSKSLVLDADALLHHSKYPSFNPLSTVLTPHAGEFHTITNVSIPSSQEKRISLVQQWAQQLGATLVLKGPVDIITDGVHLKQNMIHNEAMTVGGTGDVLAGIIGALLSKGLSGYDASRLATFINGAAGNHAYEWQSYGLLATDVIRSIPVVLKNYL